MRNEEKISLGVTFLNLGVVMPPPLATVGVTALLLLLALLLMLLMLLLLLLLLLLSLLLFMPLTSFFGDANDDLLLFVL